MKCPHCEKEISGSPCPQCGEMTPEEADYCMKCGSSMQEEAADPPEVDDSEFDFDDRVLCSDGTCTGIIIDGKCSECGKA